MSFCRSVSSALARKARARSMDMSESSAMDLPPTVTASASRFKRLPPHSGQGTCAM